MRAIIIVVRPTSISLSLLILLLSSFVAFKDGAQDFLISRNSRTILTELHGNTCSTDDLNHSILIENNSTSNYDHFDGLKTRVLWPKNKNTIVHISSSRFGNRFDYKTLTSLNEYETIYSKFIDINTTIYVDTSKKFQKVYGFGTSINLALNSQKADHNKPNLESILKAPKPIIKDLFSYSSEGNNFSILRLNIDYKNVLLRFNMSTLLYELDQIMGLAMEGKQISDSNKINLILSFDSLDQNKHEIIDNLKLISQSCNQNEANESVEQFKYIKCSVISVSKDWILSGFNAEGMMDFLETTLFSEKILLLSELKLSDGPNFLDKLTTSQDRVIGGLLTKSEYSLPYDVMDYLRSYQSNRFKILSLSSDKFVRGNYGDWQNAQNTAMEIMKYFETGSNGFIEDGSFVDVLDVPMEDSFPKKQRDASIYNLYDSYGIHYKGPMFYAIGHFSKFVLPGSIKLGQIISTQPNSFASRSISFLTPNNYIIVIALNNNDHMLQYKVVIDNFVVANTNIDPKSFNTFVIKL